MREVLDTLLKGEASYEYEERSGYTLFGVRIKSTTTHFRAEGGSAQEVVCNHTYSSCGWWWLWVSQRFTDQHRYISHALWHKKSKQPASLGSLQVE